MDIEKSRKIRVTKKIWEEFLKGKSINYIAKKEGINKAVVSTIINYTIPEWITEAENTCLNEIKKKEEQLKRLNANYNKLKRENKKLENDNELNLYANIFLAMLITLGYMFARLPKLKIFGNLIDGLATMAAITAAIVGTQYLIKKVLKWIW